MEFGTLNIFILLLLLLYILITSLTKIQKATSQTVNHSTELYGDLLQAVLQGNFMNLSQLLFNILGTYITVGRTTGDIVIQVLI